MTIDPNTIAIIGGGNMGTALAQGLLEAGIVSASDLVVVELNADRRQQLAELLPGAVIVDSIRPCGAVVIAVKPPDTPAAASAAVAAGAKRVVSIAAGVTVASLEAACGPGVAVIRSMPNTPSLVGEGVTAIAAGSSATDEDLAWAESILGAVGLVVRVPEDKIDAITGVTGSGPAYLFLIAEALIDAAEVVGLDKSQADVLVRQLFVGSAALLAEGEDPAVLRARVTSPGGTTAAGIAALEAASVRDAFRAAVEAATARSRELGQ
ncbi:MAG: pyrroline-5-carboxylate reductase [Actinomycetota bacterium]